MIKQSTLNKAPKVDYYVTGGTCMGRILACKLPFNLGNGVYHLTTDLQYWEVQGEKTLTEEQLIKAIEDIRDEKIAVLKESVRLNAHLGVTLVEDPKWIFRLVDVK